MNTSERLSLIANTYKEIESLNDARKTLFADRKLQLVTSDFQAEEITRPIASLNKIDRCQIDKLSLVDTLLSDHESLGCAMNHTGIELKGLPVAENYIDKHIILSLIELMDVNFVTESMLGVYISFNDERYTNINEIFNISYKLNIASSVKLSFSTKQAAVTFCESLVSHVESKVFVFKVTLSANERRTLSKIRSFGVINKKCNLPFKDPEEEQKHQKRQKSVIYPPFF